MATSIRKTDDTHSEAETDSGWPRGVRLAVLGGLAFAHLVLCTILTFRYSPTENEVAHLPAGLAIWRTGRFDLYKVNPPLPRLVAAIPLIMSPHQEDWSRYTANTARRPEWQVAHDFFEANGERSFEFFRMARWACLPFLLLGLIVCWRWGRELRGDWGGLMAASLWCFSPNILGHGSLITPDVPAVACGLLAAWRFSHWLKSPTWKNGTLAGICLGVALLTKTYWVSLLMIWPCLWLVWRCGQLSADRSASPRSWGGEFLQLTAILLLGLHILNTGYLYQGTGTPLREFNFYSRSFTGKSLDPELDPPGNRFRERIWGGIPVPFPQEYLLGIDVQKWDFEQRMWSYLLGEWSQEGWWHYYLVGLFFKVPVGVWILCAWALGSFIRNRNLRREFAPLLALVVPALGILLLASLQRGMNHHVRYVFAMLPVLYLVSTGTIVGTADRHCGRLRRWALAILAVFAIVESLSAYPHSLSFVNLSAGGLHNGPNALLHSNMDWGQDVLLLKKWIEEHPDQRPVTVVPIPHLPRDVIGQEIAITPTGDLAPGWHIVSVRQTRDPRGFYREFVGRTPIERIGTCYEVFLIEPGAETR